MSPADAGLASIHFRHEKLGIAPFGEEVSVTAVVGGNPVVVPKLAADTYSHRFLSDVEMDGAGQIAGQAVLSELLLDTANAQHVTIKAKHLLVGEVGVGAGAGHENHPRCFELGPEQDHLGARG